MHPLLAVAAAAAVLLARVAGAAELCGTLNGTALFAPAGNLSVGANYPPNLDCSAVLVAPAGLVVRVTFTALNVEDGFDYVTLYDGPSSTGVSAVSYTGSVVPAASATSTGPLLAVRFQSDKSVSGGGWALRWEFAAAALLCPGPSNATGAAGPNATGALRDRQFPSTNYASNLNCSAAFAAPPGLAVELTVTAFRSESGYDFLYIHDGGDAAALKRTTVTGAPAVPFTVTGTQRLLFLRWTTDRSIVDVGWTLTWRFVAPSQLRCPGPGLLTAPAASGGISDPVGYAPNLDCSVRLTAGAGQVVEVTFTLFRTEANWDFLTLYDGPTTGATPLLHQSGAPAVPFTVRSRQPDLLLRWTTDASTSSDGWALAWRFVTATPTPTLSPSATPTRSGTATRTRSATRSRSPTRSRSATLTATASPSGSASASLTRIHTLTRSATRTRSPTRSRSATLTATSTLTPSPSRTASPTPTGSGTATPSPRPPPPPPGYREVGGRCGSTVNEYGEAVHEWSCTAYVP